MYYASKYHGAESIDTSSSYYRLGDCFLAQGNVESSLALFDKVVDIWYKYLSALHAGTNKEEQILSEEILSDGHDQLTRVLNSRVQLLGENHIAVGEAAYTLGLFDYFLLGSSRVAEELVQRALTIYVDQHGEQNA